jgi:hypothetical protein
MSDPGADDQDYKWLVARERGEDIGHVPPAERAPYDQLGALIGRGVAPNAGFRQRVLGAIDAIDAAEAAKQTAAGGAEPALAPVVPLRPRPAQEPREQQPTPQKPQRQASRRWLAVGGAMTAAAAAAVALLVIRPGRPAGAELAVEGRIERGRAAVRADRTSAEALLGDTLAVTAEASGPAEVRVYGGAGERLLARCDDHGGQDGCQIEHDGERRRFSLAVPLNAPGRVRVVIFAGASVPAPQGSIDQDLGAAERAHIKYEVGKQEWAVR